MTKAAATTKRPDTRPRESLGDRAGTWAAGALASAGIVYYAAEHPFVKALHHDNVPLMHGEHRHTLPAAAILAYLVMVHVLRPVYNKVVPGTGPKLSLVLQGWNLFLWVLSMVMLFGMAGPLFRHAKAHDFSVHAVLCDAKQERWEGPGYFWVYVFALSKFVELVDTFWLVVRKKPVVFLHWYHHATVLAYTWYAVSSRFSPGFFFAEVNAAIHCLLYFYYSRAAAGYKLTYDKLITQVQLIQMVIGIALTGSWAYFHLVDPRPCPTDTPVTMMTAAVLMYASYFVLFALFYIKRYNANKARKAAAAKKAE